MDEKRLEEVRFNLKSMAVFINNIPVHDLAKKEDAIDLLDYIDTLKADMAKIRALALQLTALSYLPAATAGSEIYNLAAQHADEPEV